MASPVRSTWIAAHACVLAGAFGLAAAVAAQPVNPQAAADAAFVARAKAYVEMRDRIAASVGKLQDTKDPAEIARRTDVLGAAVRQARGDATEGAVFGDLAPRVRAVVKHDWATRPAADRRGLKEDMPAQATLAVNAPYPPTAALATMPPRLLQALPPLPESLEYRLAGRSLVLRDRRSNLIVDLVRDVLPGGSS